jgi:regulation of enolase protein 1 (concanavalin A-like superfamily)
MIRLHARSRSSSTWRSRTLRLVVAQAVACAVAVALPALASAASTATFTFPLNGAANVDTVTPFTWTAIAGVQTYDLYIGTTQGGDDLFNSDGILTTSIQVPPLPVGETLWARIWTEVGGAFTYQDISFEVSTTAANFTFPANGATGVSTAQQMAWNPAPDAQGYIVWLGSARGAKNLGLSSGLAATADSWTMPALAVGSTVWARLFTEINGNWLTYEDIEFTVGASPAAMTYPSPNTLNVGLDTSKAFTWNAAAGVSGYELWIGTTEGGDDVLSSGALPATQTSYAVGLLPVGEPLWVRLWTESSAGVFAFAGDVQFTPGAKITSPVQQLLRFSPSNPIKWAPGETVDAVAPQYELKVGDGPGSSDLYDSGRISATAVKLPATVTLPTATPLYAQVIYYLGDHTQRRADDVFEVGGTPTPSQMTWGGNGSSNVDTSLPFAWSSDPLAQAYQLNILSGSTVVTSSGPIQVPEYFDEALPVGSYTAQLQTEIGFVWYTSSASFTVTRSASSAFNEIAAAHWATNYVRQMADSADYAYSWTPLDTALKAQGTYYQATCAYFANELLAILHQMNIAADQTAAHQPQIINIYFDALDGHTLVQFWDSADGYWIPLDATFDMAAVNAGTGQWASPQEIEAATQASDWSAISYASLGPAGFADANDYYLDYPLLWLNPAGQSPWNSPAPYMTRVGTWPSGGPTKVYSVTASQQPASITVNGRPYTPTFDTTDPFSLDFLAAAVAPAAGGSPGVSLYEPNCYVFTANVFCPTGSTPQTGTAPADPYATYSSGQSTLFEEQSGSFGINATGGDVYGPGGQYSSVYVPGGATTSSTTTVEVAVLPAGNANGKAGLMIRNLISQTSSTGLALIEQTAGGVAFEWDSSGSGYLNASDVVAVSRSAPLWLRLVRSGGQVTGEYSTDDATWTTVGSAALTGAAPTEDAGMFVSAGGGSQTGVFSNFTTTSGAFATYGSTPSTSADELVAPGGSLTIDAGGDDVWSGSNQFGAIYVPGGAGPSSTTTVEVDAQTADNAWSKTGIMLRDSIATAGASQGFATLAVTPQNGIALQWDATGSGQLGSDTVAGVGTGTPVWLRMVRRAGQVTGEYSLTGSTWTTVATVAPAGADPSEDAGVFAVSHDAATVGQSSFSSFGIQ